MRDHPLLERELLAGALGTRYQIVRLIGRGGAGSVFLCRDTALHRTVAIKMLRPEYATVPDHRELFRREARLGAQLGDHGTVPVLDVIERDDVFAFVMPYAGISLREMVERNGPLDAHVVRALLMQVAQVLSRLHRRGLHHRDIKPDNVLVEGEGDETRVRLSDFGIATKPLVDGGINSPMFVSGTPQFMSPEQALQTVEADQRSDVYALGVLAYFLLTGSVPFAASAVHEVIALQQREKYRRLRECITDIPRDLERIVRRCLRADPSRRWASASLVWRALENAMQPTRGERVRARIAQWRHRAHAWWHRTPPQLSSRARLARVR